MRKEPFMARPKGATNKSPRELKAEGKNLIEKAKLKERLARLLRKKSK
jgi:hypothetical protein